MKNKKRTMTFHLWRDFGMFAVIIMASLWLLQIIFLNAFYESMKENEIEKVGKQLAEFYYSDTEKFNEYWEQHSLGGIFSNLLSADGTIIKSQEPMGEFRHQPAPGRGFNRSEPNRIADFNNETWQKFTQWVSESADKTTTYVLESRMPVRMMIFGAELISDSGEKVYLYLSSAIEPIDATRQVLQNQLIIVSVLSFILAISLAYYIAKRFSRPIESVTASAKKLADGKYDARFEGGSYKEISELADVLNDTSQKLAKTDELRRDLMANVSHDLKTPLTIIKSYAEMIRDISGENKQKRDTHTQVIIDEVNRLSLLVNDILKLSKLEAGALPIQKQKFEISALCRSITEHFSVYCEKDGYVIESDIEDGIYVDADETQMTQVVYNLIGNALNYTGADMTVRLKLQKDGDMVGFEVTDSGDGISADEIGYVWDKYYRSAKTHKREVVGTGIGLSIVKQILEAHGADYGVRSELGKGSVFYFRLRVSE